MPRVAGGSYGELALSYGRGTPVRCGGRGLWFEDWGSGVGGCRFEGLVPTSVFLLGIEVGIDG